MDRGSTDRGSTDRGGMDRGSTDRGSMSRSDASALADLQMHWDEAYVIGLDGDIWSARYHSSSDELRAHTSTELRGLIRSDYAYRQKADLATWAPGEDEDLDEDDQNDEEHVGDVFTGTDVGDERNHSAAGGRRDEVEGGNFATLRGERMST
jgi:hypothetical protein